MKLDVHVCYFKNGDVCASRDCRGCGVTVERVKTTGILNFNIEEAETSESLTVKDK